MLYTRTRLMGL